MSANVIVSSQCGSSLRLPVSTMPIYSIAVDEPWVVFTYPMLVATFARTILANAFMMFESDSVAPKRLTTIKAGKPSLRSTCFGAFLGMSILAFRRTMFASAILGAGRVTLKLFSAMFTDMGSSFPTSRITAFLGAIFDSA